MITPCISICKLIELDDKTRICQGCGRSQMEIFQWSKYTEAERIEIMRRLGHFKKRRLTQEEKRRRYDRG